MIKFSRLDHDGSVCDNQHPLLCGFGITEALGTAIAGFLTADVGVGAATAGTLGTIGAGALEGGAIGAITDPKNPLKGAEAGAITGGVASGLGPVIGSTLGTGATVSDALAGVVGGGLGAAVTGQNIGTGALTGGVGGAISGALSTTGTPAGAAGGSSAPGGPVGSAAANAAPASVATGGAPDAITGINSGADASGIGGLGTGGTPPDISTAPPGSAGLVAGQGATPSTGGTPGGGTPSAISSPTIGSAPANSVSDAAALNPVKVTPATQISGYTPPSGGGLGDVGSFLKGNAGWLVPAAALAYEGISSNSTLPGEKQLTANANALNAQAGTLENYFNTGTLPPGIQSGLNQASSAASAAIRSQYASTIGGGTSSAESQDLAAVGERAAAQGSQIALSLLQQGVSEQGMADSLYTELMDTSLQQDQQLGSAIGSFAAALVPRTITTAAAA